ncbi:AAA family ATPase [Gluconacetobacter diazotrophicus]|uniref:AAA family ATPase n=1 Tax=Gluconacetobacter diazotrophicus TaxID=33996 RepID=UPI0003148CFF|nr:AAA family ATPase [Gluconacetobacter diazotrophicus]
MKLTNLEIFNIKSFKEVVSINFDNDTKIFSFSGINGSGKSTILKSISIIQKLFFSIKSNALSDFYTELGDFLSRDAAYISCEFAHNGDKGTIKLFRSFSEYKYTIENNTLFDETWGSNTPDGIILYIDSNRFIQNDSVEFSSISLDNMDDKNVLEDIVRCPEKLFSTIYKKIISDYLYGRLLPAKPDRLTYFHVAQKFFEKLIPHVSIRNFSGKHVEREFVLLGKNGSDPKSKQYDIRNFSSGEKSLFSILNLLFLTNKISTIIIDEPENNFHLTLLMDFMRLLKDFCDGSVCDKISELNTAQSGKVINNNWINSLYSEMNLHNVIIATHSKELIYKVFAYGKNFLVSDDVVEIEEKNAEIELRKLGLSQVDKRILFVEGRTDRIFLENALSNYDITVKDLSGGESVISTWKKIQKIKNDIKNVDFVFLVDSDNRKRQILSEASSIDPEFSNLTLVVLDRHEVESYLLDIDNIYISIYKITNELGLSRISKIKVKTYIIESYKKTRSTSILKDTLNNTREYVNYEMSNLLWGNRKFREKIKSMNSMSKDDILGYLGNDFLENIATEILDIVNTTRDDYDENLTFDEFVSKCDGKSVFNTFCSKISAEIGVKKDIIYGKILSHALSSDTSLLKYQLDSIIERFPDFQTNGYNTSVDYSNDEE